MLFSPQKPPIAQDGTHMIVFGGQASYKSPPTTTVEIYSSSSRSWQSVSSNMSVARRNHRVVPVGRNIYVIGGFSDTDAYLRSCEVFNTGTNRWSPIADMTHVRREMATAAIDSDRI